MNNLLLYNKPVFQERIFQETFFSGFDLARRDTSLFGLLKVKLSNTHLILEHGPDRALVRILRLVNGQRKLVGLITAHNQPLVRLQLRLALEPLHRRLWKALNHGQKRTLTAFSHTQTLQVPDNQRRVIDRDVGTSLSLARNIL